MKKDYISNQLIKLLYNETTVSEELALNRMISDEVPLRKEYEEMKNIKAKLDHSMQKPSFSSVQMILDYGKKQQREASF